jgi:hypothetical protein
VIVGQPDDGDKSARKVDGKVVGFEHGPIWAQVLPGRGVAVVLRSAVEWDDWYHWNEAIGNVGVDGILEISADLSDYGKSVYRLTDATLDTTYVLDGEYP